jgi:hypothetical protein
MTRTPAIAMSFAIAASAFCLSAIAQTTSPPSTCTVPPAPPEPLMITMPKAPVEPACNKGAGCTKAVIAKYSGEMNAFNEAIAKANEVYVAYQEKLRAVTAASNAYGNCEIARINKFMQERVQEAAN